MARRRKARRRTKRARNPLELDPPEHDLDDEDLGEELVTSVSWKEGGRRRSKRVVLPPELADPRRLARAARSEAVYQAQLADLEKVGKAGAPLLRFLRKLGGIVVDPKDHPLSGELRHAFETMKGSRTRGVLKKRGNGVTLARASERVAEAGYDHQRDDQAGLLDMIETEARLGDTFFPRYANPLRRGSGPGYSSRSTPPHGRKRPVAKRRKTTRRKTTTKSRRRAPARRKRNPVPIYAVNPKRKRRRTATKKKTTRRRKRNPAGGFKAFLSKLKPTSRDAGASVGLVAADMGAAMVSKWAGAGPGVKETLFHKGARILGAFLGARAAGVTLGVIPSALTKRMAPGAIDVAWAASIQTGIREVVIPAIPEGKVKNTLAEYGLRGTMPQPLNGYVVDADRGYAYQLNGAQATPIGFLPSAYDDDEDLDGLSDLDDDELELVLSGEWDDDEDLDGLEALAG